MKKLLFLLALSVCTAQAQFYPPPGGGVGTGTPGGSTNDIQTNAGGGNFGGVTPGAGIATWLATPTSANLATALSDENGSGKAIFSAGTLAITTGKTLTVSNILTLTATDGSTLAIGAGGTLGTAAYTASTAYQAADADLTTWAGVTPGTNVAALLRTASTAVNFSEVALTADLGTLAFINTVDFTDLSGRAAHDQIDYTPVAPSKSSVTITGATGGSYIYTVDAASTVTTLAISGSANAADETHFQLKFATDLTYPFTFNIPTCVRLGAASSGSGATIVIPEAATHELSFHYDGANTILADSVVSTNPISDTAYSSAGNGVTTIGWSKNVLYDYLHVGDTDDDGKADKLDVGAGALETDSSGVLSAYNNPVIWVAMSDETTVITTGTAKVTVRAPYAFTVTGVRASVNTVSSSGLPTVDINEAGTTILSTKLTIDASEFTSVSAATPAVVSDTAIADDAEITFDVDVAGTGAKGLKVCVYGHR